MFRSARLKLAGWYLLIIMLISIAFSLFIYNGTIRELEAGFDRAAAMIRMHNLNMSGLQDNIELQLRNNQSMSILNTQFKKAKEAVRYRLLLVNGFILIFSAGIGYFLAGKTLRPIEETMRAQKRFVSDASHELRTPITALKTSLEVNLRDKSLSKQAKDVLEENLETVDSLALLADRLLRMTPSKRGIEDLQLEEINISEIMQKVLKQIALLASKKNIEIKTTFEPNLPAIEADKASINELFFIFLDNAIKYSEEGSSILVNITSSVKFIVITIKDTGIGIEDNHLPYIFNRFYQADDSRSKKDSGGFGLGLALAKSIIEAHQGTVDVDSSVGKGTAFNIKLPLRRET